MVGFLCYRVWIVWRGGEIAVAPPPKAPAEEGAVDISLPPSPVSRGVPPPLSELTGRNPLWLYSPVPGGSSTESQGGNSSQEAPDLKLLGFQGTGEKAMARIEVAGRSKYYKTGAKAGGYTVVRIDAEAKQVDLTEDSTGRSITLSPQG